MNSVFFRLINTKNITFFIFGCWLLREKFRFCPKNNNFALVRGAASPSPSPPGSYAYEYYHTHKSAVDYSEPGRVRTANKTTIVVGQWTAIESSRLCIKHQQPAIKQRLQPVKSQVQPRPTDVKADDDQGPIIAFPHRRPPRRSTRLHRKRRDLCPGGSEECRA